MWSFYDLWLPIIRLLDFADFFGLVSRDQASRIGSLGTLRYQFVNVNGTLTKFLRPCPSRLFVRLDSIAFF